MRFLRPFAWAAVLVAAFLYITSVAHWNVARLLPADHGESFGPGHGWTEPAASSASTYTPDELNNIQIYKAAREGTVNVTSVVYRQDWFFQVYPEQGAGSGFIINSDGEILTNYHVVRGSRDLSVTLENKKTYKARLLGVDTRNDLALIKVNIGYKLPVLPLGNSDALEVGQKVLAIGNPFGQFGGTLTTGVISSLGRSIQTQDGRPLEGMIQTDAAINPGNSGGPLLDSHGNVIGINTAIISETNVGIGFAMPINRAKSMLEEFHSSGRISRATLGITTVYLPGDLAQELDLPASGGLLIQRVERGSAADDAGLRGPSQVVNVGAYPLGIGGDLIVTVDGQPVTGTDSLQRVINRKRGGDPLDLTVYRNGRRVNLHVKLGEAPQTL